MLPPPFVIDADVLIRNVGYAVRRGHNESLIGHGRHGYGLRLGIPLYATLAVAREVEDHLPEVAERCGKPVGEVVATWNEVFLPRILFVPITSDEVVDERLAEMRRLAPKDAPTAALAILIADSVVLTHNYKHFRPLGIPKVAVKEIAIEAQTLSGVLRQAEAAAALPTLVGYGVHAGAKRFLSAVGAETSLVLGLCALGAIVLYWEAETMRRTRRGVVMALKEIGPPIADALERGEAASAALYQLAVKPSDHLTALSFVARELAMTNSLTTKEIADRLRIKGFSFYEDGDHRTRTRAWLASCECFYEYHRGHWSLGYLIEDAALSVPGAAGEGRRS